MSKKKSFDDNVLISLKRAYGKDEYVAKLLKKIESLEFEKGVITSEKDEALYLVSKFKKADPRVKARYCQTMIYRKLKDELKATREALRKEKITSSKYLSELLQIKQNKK